MEQLQFVVMGAGAWGTAMAIHLSKLGHRVILSPRNVDKAQRMQEMRENSFYLSEVPFPDTLQVDTHFEAYLDACGALFIACPTQGLLEVCERLTPYKNKLKRIVSLVKGLERNSLKAPSDWFSEHLPQVECFCLSGPTYAKDFALGKRAAMVLASAHSTANLQKAISNDSVRVYSSSDLKGVELGSCLKNIYALGAGILEGLHLGDNAKAAYFEEAEEKGMLGYITGIGPGVDVVWEALKDCCKTVAGGGTLGDGLINGAMLGSADRLQATQDTAETMTKAQELLDTNNVHKIYVAI